MGRHLSEEHKKKISEANKKNYIENYERRIKVSGRIRGVKRSEETKRKIGDANRGKHRTEEAKHKMSEAMKRRYKDNPMGEERRKEISERMKALWRNPNYLTMRSLHIPACPKEFIETHKRTDILTRNLKFIKLHYRETCRSW